MRNKSKIVNHLVNLVTTAPSETQSLGQVIGSSLPKPFVVGIDGPLGSGKTCLVQGIAKGLGVPADTLVTSPAYTLVQEYSVEDQTFIHIDFYRLDDLTPDDYFLFEELFRNPNRMIVVEWSSKFLPDLISDFLQISIDRGDETNHRCLNFFSDSEPYFALLHELRHYAKSCP
ncbi:MAG: tRNA (adenosine(37)-N6)-threonylcarbamoyltransferase complex ATPase subunit type 1 TsaE [Bacteroidetes bacterium]|nr:tRNA (adenosine(37)-N6)-threonylcarbamoyltransferase complex ATPase subunit type 1 TsaE [Bacteroidota bacterium]